MSEVMLTLPWRGSDTPHAGRKRITVPGKKRSLHNTTQRRRVRTAASFWAKARLNDDNVAVLWMPEHLNREPEEPDDCRDLAHVF